MKKKISQNNKVLQKIEKGTEKQVVKEYQKALKEIRNILAKAYEKYDMNMAEMQKYKRLESLEKEIQREVTKLSVSNTNVIKKGIKESYEGAYLRTGFLLETQLQTKLSYSMVNPKIIKNVINNDVSGLRWVERMGRNRADFIFQMKQELSQGLIQGESYTKMAKRLRDRLDVDFNKAVTIARTESGRAREQGAFDSMEHAAEKGVKLKKRWVSSLDGDTRDSHADLDGEVVEVDQPFSNGLMYPGDPAGPPEEVINCRCTHIVEIEGFEPTERRIRGEGVVPYTNYRDWEKNRVGK